MKKHLYTSKFVVAVDVGTTKIGVLIAEWRGGSDATVVGIGRAPSHGLSRGVVVDVAPAVDAIKRAVAEAELLAGCRVDTVVVGVSGVHVATHQSSGMVPIKHGTIREHDIQRVAQSAKTIPLLDDEQILHSFPLQYVIDGKHIVRDPLHMKGVRLECTSHIITGNVTMVKNVVECCQLAGLHVQDIVLEPVASAAAVLNPDERELGVALLDIGGGTSDFALYKGEKLCFTKILPVAGTLFTNDLAMCLRISRDEAERIKREFGTVCTQEVDEQIPVSDFATGNIRYISKNEIAAILGARAQELVDQVGLAITQHELAYLMKMGLVITGGGALLRGLPELLAAQLQIPVRIGIPIVTSGFAEELSQPLYATGYGLIQYHLQQQGRMRSDQGSLPQRIFWQMKSWISDVF